MRVDLASLRQTPGFGVAGNFAGHLEQAGEAGDFAGVRAESGAPRGLFPWYLPGADGFLGTFPLASDRLIRPVGDVHLQIEPEVGLLCSLVRDGGRVVAIEPRAVAAFDDCSIRRPGARKISEKKNWGPCSKGVAATALEVTDLAPDGPTATLRLASFLRRDGVAHAYGIDSRVVDYSYYGERLLGWMVDTLATQADDGPLEQIGALLGDATGALVGIGATRYTDFGESTFLQAGDDAIVIVYDEQRHSPQEVEAAAQAGAEAKLAGASVLVQRVEDA